MLLLHLINVTMSSEHDNHIYQLHHSSYRIAVLVMKLARGEEAGFIGEKVNKAAGSSGQGGNRKVIEACMNGCDR